MNTKITFYKPEKDNWTFVIHPIIVFERYENEYSISIAIFFWCIEFKLII